MRRPYVHKIPNRTIPRTTTNHRRSPEKQFIITAEGLEQWKASFISGGRSLPERYADRLEKIGSEFFARELVEKGLAKAAEKE